MARSDDEPGSAPIRKVAHEVGQDLSRLSVDELEARIELLREEIVRIETAARSKAAQLSAADMLFKR